MSIDPVMSIDHSNEDKINQVKDINDRNITHISHFFDMTNRNDISDNSDSESIDEKRKAEIENEILLNFVAEDKDLISLIAV